MTQKSAFMRTRTLGLLVILASCYTVFGQEGGCVVEDNGNYYDLNPLKGKDDYVVRSDSGLEFKINVCTGVISETWRLDNPSIVGGFYRGAHSDLSIGNANTTIVIKDSNPLLLFSGGSPCGESASLNASTAIRFVCDSTVFDSGKPQLIAQFPPEDESACGFSFEWRTHVACPTAKPGSAVIAILAAVALILLLTYIVAGVMYRRLVLGYRGLEQFPRLSIIPLSSIPRYWSEFTDWLSDIRDSVRGGARDLWPRTNVNSRGGSLPTSWRDGRGGFSPLAREEEEAMFRDGPDGPDTRFSLEEDIGSAQELAEPTPSVPSKPQGDDHNGGAIRF